MNDVYFSIYSMQKSVKKIHWTKQISWNDRRQSRSKVIYWISTACRCTSTNSQYPAWSYCTQSEHWWMITSFEYCSMIRRHSFEKQLNYHFVPQLVSFYFYFGDLRFTAARIVGILAIAVYKIIYSRLLSDKNKKFQSHYQLIHFQYSHFKRVLLPKRLKRTSCIWLKWGGEIPYNLLYWNDMRTRRRNRKNST